MFVSAHFPRCKPPYSSLGFHLYDHRLPCTAPISHTSSACPPITAVADHPLRPRFDRSLNPFRAGANSSRPYMKTYAVILRPFSFLTPFPAAAYFRPPVSPPTSPSTVPVRPRGSPLPGAPGFPVAGFPVPGGPALASPPVAPPRRPPSLDKNWLADVTCGFGHGLKSETGRASSDVRDGRWKYQGP